MDRHHFTADPDLTGVHLVGAEYRARHLRAPRPHEPGETQDLALAHDKIHILDGAAAIEMANLQHHLVVHGGGHRAFAFKQSTPHHHADDGFHAGRRGGHGGNVLAVTHHRHTIRYPLQFVHLVRDVDDARAVALELADDAKQVFDFGVVQRGGGLVHDEHARIERQGLGDFHHLLPGDRQIADQSSRVQVQMQAFEYRAGVPLHFLRVDEHAGPPLRFATDEYVLRHAAVVHQVEFLMDDADAQGLRGARIGNVHQLPVNANLAFVFLVDTREHLHKGRLTRPVFPHQGVHLTGQQFEPAVVQGAHTREGFAQVLDGHKRGHRRASGLVILFGSSRRHGPIRPVRPWSTTRRRQITPRRRGYVIYRNQSPRGCPSWDCYARFNPADAQNGSEVNRLTPVTSPLLRIARPMRSTSKNLSDHGLRVRMLTASSTPSPIRFCALSNSAKLR